VCGSGTSDVLVFDGVPPYSIICTDTRVAAASLTSTTQPGRFTINVGQQAAGQCLDAVPCVILDANNTRAILSISTKVGAAATPPAPITVAPLTMTLTCGASGSATVVGGTGTYSAASSSTRVSAAVSGNTVTITRLNGDGVTVVSDARHRDDHRWRIRRVRLTSPVPPNCP
jgi:hypothetical protein